MITYKSERINNGASIFKRWLVYTLVISIPVLASLLFPKLNLIDQSSQVSWIIFVVLFSIQELISLFQQDTINEISIDTDNKKLILQYYDANKGQVKKKLFFENLQVKLNRIIWIRNADINSIYFFNGKREMFEISKYKDGFSTSSLNDISRVLESLTQPLDK
jgi:hypothetical protein